MEMVTPYESEIFSNRDKTQQKTNQSLNPGFRYFNTLITMGGTVALRFPIPTILWPESYRVVVKYIEMFEKRMISSFPEYWVNLTKTL